MQNPGSCPRSTSPKGKAWTWHGSPGTFLSSSYCLGPPHFHHCPYTMHALRVHTEIVSILKHTRPLPWTTQFLLGVTPLPLLPTSLTWWNSFNSSRLSLKVSFSEKPFLITPSADGMQWLLSFSWYFTALLSIYQKGAHYFVTSHLLWPQGHLVSLNKCFSIKSNVFKQYF